MTDILTQFRERRAAENGDVLSRVRVERGLPPVAPPNFGTIGGPGYAKRQKTDMLSPSSIPPLAGNPIIQYAFPEWGRGVVQGFAETTIGKMAMPVKTQEGIARTRPAEGFAGKVGQMAGSMVEYTNPVTLYPAVFGGAAGEASKVLEEGGSPWEAAGTGVLNALATLGMFKFVGGMGKSVAADISSAVATGSKKAVASAIMKASAGLAGGVTIREAEMAAKQLQKAAFGRHEFDEAWKTIKFQAPEVAAGALIESFIIGAGGIVHAQMKGEFARMVNERIPLYIERANAARTPAERAKVMDEVKAEMEAIRAREVSQEQALREGVKVKEPTDASQVRPMRQEGEGEVQGQGEPVRGVQRKPEQVKEAGAAEEVGELSGVPFIAIRLKDGSILSDPSVNSHAELVEVHGIELSDIRSSGFDTDGEYSSAQEPTDATSRKQEVPVLTEGQEGSKEVRQEGEGQEEVVEPPKKAAEPPETTALKNESMDRDLEKITGAEAEGSPERKSFQQAKDEAIEKGIPDRALDIANEIMDDPQRGLSYVEGAGFTVAIAKVKNQHADANKRLKETSDPVGRITINGEIQELERQFELLYAAGKLAGTEQGRELVGRKLTIDQNYDLVSLLQQAKDAKEKALTPKERQKFVELEERLTEMQKQLDEAHKKAEIEKAKRTIVRSKARNQSVRAKDAELHSLYAKAKTLLDAGCK